MIIVIILGSLGLLTVAGGAIYAAKQGESGLFDLDAYRNTEGRNTETERQD